MSSKPAVPAASARRRFLLVAIASTASLVLLPLARGRGWALAAAPVVDLDEKDPMAVALGYHRDAAKVDAKKWTKHAGPEGKKQTCSNCMFFPKDAKGKGTCTIFPGKNVEAKGWCNSWTLRA